MSLFPVLHIIVSGDGMLAYMVQFVHSIFLGLYKKEDCSSFWDFCFLTSVESGCYRQGMAVVREEGEEEVGRRERGREEGRERERKREREKGSFDGSGKRSGDSWSHPFLKLCG